MASLYEDRNQEKVDAVKSDDESDESAYERWKARELRRLERNREERKRWVSPSSGTA